MNKDYIFYGTPVTQVQFGVFMALINQGTCPFCHKTGFSNRYGSFAKHRKACYKKHPLDTAKPAPPQGGKDSE